MISLVQFTPTHDFSLMTQLFIIKIQSPAQIMIYYKQALKKWQTGQTNVSNVYALMLDASKSFDRVNYCKLFRVLLKHQHHKFEGCEFKTHTGHGSFSKLRQFRLPYFASVYSAANEYKHCLEGTCDGLVSRPGESV